MNTPTILIILAAVILLATMSSMIIAYADRLPPGLAGFVEKLRGAIRSKTVWANTLVLVFFNQLPGLVDYASTNLPQLQGVIPANHYQFIVGAITITNLILRFKTTHPLEAK